jgi:hypothetical protein
MTTWGDMAGKPQQPLPGEAITRDDLLWLIKMAEENLQYVALNSHLISEAKWDSALEDVGRLDQIKNSLGLT